MLTSTAHLRKPMNYQNKSVFFSSPWICSHSKLTSSVVWTIATTSSIVRPTTGQKLTHSKTRTQTRNQHTSNSQSDSNPHLQCCSRRDTWIHGHSDRQERSVDKDVRNEVTDWKVRCTKWFKYDRDWFVCKQAAVSPGHIWTTLYINFLTI